MPTRNPDAPTPAPLPPGLPQTAHVKALLEACGVGGLGISFRGPVTNGYQTRRWRAEAYDPNVARQVTIWLDARGYFTSAAGCEMAFTPTQAAAFKATPREVFALLLERLRAGYPRP
jgi:hypothetical protein